jgi:hypothetical protein
MRKGRGTRERHHWTAWLLNKVTLFQQLVFSGLAACLYRHRMNDEQRLQRHLQLLRLLSSCQTSLATMRKFMQKASSSWWPD